MLLKQHIFTILFLFFFLTLEQNLSSQNVRFVRYIDSTENKIEIPITSLFYISNAIFAENNVWLLESSFETSENDDCLIIEMNPSDLPEGEWSEHVAGAFQMALRLDTGTVNITIEMQNKNSIRLINNYASKGIYTPTNELSGNLNLRRSSDTTIIINGLIQINSLNPASKQEIHFEQTNINLLTLNEYQVVKQRFREAKMREEEKMFNLLNEITIIETQFFDSLFNTKKYKGNKLKANFEKQSKFKFTLDRSFIVRKADISDLPSENYTDLIGSYIFFPTGGDKIVVCLHHFSEGDKKIIDDETNFSILISLTDIIKNTEYQINENSPNNTKLAYWHYGAGAKIIESSDYYGTFTVKSVENNIAIGKVNISYKSNDNKIFTLKGKIELPVIEPEIFSILNYKVNNKIQEVLGK